MTLRIKERFTGRSEDQKVDGIGRDGPGEALA
jgi:hypothetical protein